MGVRAGGCLAGWVALRLRTPLPSYDSQRFLGWAPATPSFFFFKKPCLVVWCCPFSLRLYSGTMPKYLGGSGAFVGSSDGAKREHLDSDKHKQWQQRQPCTEQQSGTKQQSGTEQQSGTAQPQQQQQQP